MVGGRGVTLTVDTQVSLAPGVCSEMRACGQSVVCILPFIVSQSFYSSSQPGHAENSGGPNREDFSHSSGV